MSPGRRAMGDSAGRGVTCEPGTCSHGSHGDTRDVLGGRGIPRGDGGHGGARNGRLWGIQGLVARWEPGTGVIYTGETATGATGEPGRGAMGELGMGVDRGASAGRYGGARVGGHGGTMAFGNHGMHLHGPGPRGHGGAWDA